MAGTKPFPSRTAVRPLDLLPRAAKLLVGVRVVTVPVKTAHTARGARPGALEPCCPHEGSTAGQLTGCSLAHTITSRASQPAVVRMIELLRSTDPVLVSFVTSLLLDAGIEHSIADAHMSVIEGSIGALPSRYSLSMSNTTTLATFLPTRE
jgi:hypothetical protein